jgi:hypothetical protein
MTLLMMDDDWNRQPLDKRLFDLRVDGMRQSDQLEHIRGRIDMLLDGQREQGLILASHGTRLKQIDRELKTVNGRLDTMDGRLGGIDRRLEEHDERFDRVDGRLETMDGKLDVIIEQLRGKN